MTESTTDSALSADSPGWREAQRYCAHEPVVCDWLFLHTCCAVAANNSALELS